MMFDGERCSLCGDSMQDPRVLSCFHTLCLKCIKQSCSAPSIKCPLCEFITNSNSIDLLPKNVIVEGSMRAKAGKRSCRNCSEKDATVYCRQCSSALCETCSDIIHRNEIFRNHETVPMGPGGSSPTRRSGSPRRADSPLRATAAASGSGNLNTAAPGFGILENCSRHYGEPLVLFDTVSKHTICRECATDGAYRGHSPLYPVEQHALYLTQEKVPNLFPLCDEISGKADTGIAAVDVALAELQSQHDEAGKVINSEIDSMIRRLNGRRAELLNELKEVTASKEQLLLKQRTTLELMKLNMHHSSSVALALLSKDKQNAQREEGLLRKLQQQPPDVQKKSSDSEESRGPSSFLLTPAALTTDERFSASSVCNIAGSTEDYLTFLAAQRIDLTACVDSKITASFTKLKDDILRKTDSVGKIIAKQTQERHLGFTGKIDDHEGLMYYLGCNCGIQLYKNPVRTGLVQVNASSVGYGRLENIVSAGRAQFCTQAEPGSWVQVTLCRPFRLTHYSFHHDEYDADCHFLRHWELQGYVEETKSTNGAPGVESNSDASVQVHSDDPIGLAAASGGGWVTLVSHENDTTVRQEHPYGTWAINPLKGQCVSSSSITGNSSATTGGVNSHNTTTAMSQYRVKMTGPNSNGNHYLMISGLELYGTLEG